MTTRMILVAAALTVTACGGAKKPSVDATEAANRKALLQFSRCMREHGVDMPDPKFSDDGGGVQLIAGKTNPDAMRTAEQACAKYQNAVKPPAGARDPGADKAFRKRALANVQCMREHGVDMPDPQFGEGGTVKQTVGKGTNPDSATFRKATAACQDTSPIGGTATQRTQK